MTGFNDRDRTGGPSASDMAMLLLQLAASQAEIGPFARRGRETPRDAARLYGAAARAVPGRKLKFA